MSLERIGYRPLLSWLSLAVLTVLVCVLGALQYRWIGEISEIERKKLQDTLQSSLSEVSRDFDTELNTACSALAARSAEVDESDRETAYANRYVRWKESARFPKFFKTIALAWGDERTLVLRMLNVDTGTFEPAQWPESWAAVKSRIESRLHHGPGPSGSIRSINETSVIDLPRFATFDRDPHGGPGVGEHDWLLLEVDNAYVAATILPDLLVRHFGNSYASDFRVAVSWRGDPKAIVYQSGAIANTGTQAVASVPLFDVMPQISGRSGGPGGPWFSGPGRRPEDGRKGPPPPRSEASGRGGDRPGPDRQGFDRQGFERRGFDRPAFDGRGPNARPGGGRWQMSISLNGGSLETVVARARQRNIAVSAAILLLMLITGGALVRFSRQAQRLAAIEMDFVTNVSHELRTPLTVIRTAAYNLRGRLANNATQVERYGTLIRQESEKLTAIVEQVLQFASAKRGRVLHEREPLSVEQIIEDSLQSSRGILEEAVCEVEKSIEPQLPAVLGDSMALRHALQNLITNAVKYGTNGTPWIGVSARLNKESGANIVEIRVADHGSGIPRDEQRHIFDAFFRGKRAVSDQIHGTGLGLNLVKTIIEAHGGKVEVLSEAGAGATFIIRIPAHETEHRNEFTNSIS